MRLIIVGSFTKLVMSNSQLWCTAARLQGEGRSTQNWHMAAGGGAFAMQAEPAPFQFSYFDGLVWG